MEYYTEQPTVTNTPIPSAGEEGSSGISSLGMGITMALVIIAAYSFINLVKRSFIDRD